MTGNGNSNAQNNDNKANANDFFSAIGGNSTVNTPQQTPANKQSLSGKDTKLSAKSDDVNIAQLQAELKMAKDGYSGSSKEARRLSLENERLKQQLEDSNQQAQANQPTNLYEALNIDKENFVFDMDEAINVEGSDSYKLYHAQIALEARRQMNDVLKSEKEAALKSQRQAALAEQKLEIQKNTGWSDEEFNDWYENKAKKVPVNLMNLYRLTNPDDVAKKTKEYEMKLAQQQKMNTFNNPTSLAGKGGTPSPDLADAVFDMIAEESGLDLSSL